MPPFECFGQNFWLALFMLSLTCSSDSIDFSLIVDCCCCCNNERVLSNEVSLNPVRLLARLRPPAGTIDGNIDEDVRAGTDREATDSDGEDVIAAIDGDKVIASLPVVIIDRFSTSVRSKLG